jgi:hypothetical protein
MIPGNRPEDIAEEEFWDTLYQRLAELEKYDAQPQDPGKLKYTQDDIDKLELDSGILYDVILIARDLAYRHGYGEGQAEEQMAQAYRESKQDE